MILKEVGSLNYLASNTSEVGVIFLHDTQPDGGRRAWRLAAIMKRSKLGLWTQGAPNPDCQILARDASNHIIINRI